MPEPIAPEAPAQPAGAVDRGLAVDWEAAERLPEFQELVHKRRGFVIPATVFFLSWYLGFILLSGYAEDFMGESIYEGFTVGYALALTQFVMVWGLSWLYLRRADRDFDPLAAKAKTRAEQELMRGPDRDRRFARPDGATATDGATTTAPASRRADS